jgi:soluble lytic murein transglycosylase-like protein
MFLSIRVILLASALLAAGACRADVYMRADAEGVLHYTNVPGTPGAADGAYQLLVALVREEAADNRAKAMPVSGAAAKYAPDVAEVAQAERIDQALLHAVITAESGYNPTAVSPKGAAGLMQLMPATAKRYAVKDSFDPAQNIRGGARYLRDLMGRFDNNLELVLAAYNAGEHAVLKHGGRIPPYRETMLYVPKVMRLYQRFTALGL